MSRNITRFVVVTAVAACFLPLCGGGVSAQAERVPVLSSRLDLSQFGVSKDLPGEFALSHSLYGSGRVLAGSTDIEGSVAQREKEYSYYWIAKALSGVLTQGKVRDGIALVRRINGVDDGAFLSYFTSSEREPPREYRVDVIDGRDLSILVQSDGFANESVEEIAKETLNVDLYCTVVGGAKVTAARASAPGAPISFGWLEVDRDPATSWFSKPVEWYRDGNAVLFVLVKELVPPPSKVPRDPAKYVGGIAPGDPRPFLRFEKSNRKALAREYYDRLPKEPSRGESQGGKVNGMPAPAPGK